MKIIRLSYLFVSNEDISRIISVLCTRPLNAI